MTDDGGRRPWHPIRLLGKVHVSGGGDGGTIFSQEELIRFFAFFMSWKD